MQEAPDVRYLAGAGLSSLRGRLSTHNEVIAGGNSVSCDAGFPCAPGGFGAEHCEWGRPPTPSNSRHPIVPSKTTPASHPGIGTAPAPDTPDRPPPRRCSFLNALPQPMWSPCRGTGQVPCHPRRKTSESIELQAPTGMAQDGTAWRHRGWSRFAETIPCVGTPRSH